jgi:prepilin-type N-terminal cleavage/methylation domain-containing protein
MKVFRQAQAKSMNRGFTLVELVLVLVLASILAISLWPRAPSTESMTLNGRAEQLASDIRYVQSLSMTTGARHCLTLMPLSGPPYNGYQLTTAASTCATTVQHPAGLNQPVPICASGNCITVSGMTNDYVLFDGLGAPYSDAATALAANAVITISDGGSKTVTISPATGRVLVQ